MAFILTTEKSLNGRTKPQPVMLDEELLKEIVRLAVEQAAPIAAEQAAKMAVSMVESEIYQALGKQFVFGAIDAAKGLIGRLIAIGAALLIGFLLFLASKGFIKI